jgi:hypothetical protein
MAGIVAGAIIGGVISIGSTIFAASKAKKAEKKAARRAKRAGNEIKRLEGLRQEVINPYAGVSNLSDMAQDVSSMATNQTLNLSVATGAAEMQIEEADIALANTLDTLASTGASAGGATALAQAALQSKKGVAASIETQEANNNQLREQSRVEGERRIENLKMSEAQRIQGINMSEAGRMQQAETAGAIFQFDKTETRQMQALNRQAAIQQGAEQAEVNAIASGNAAIAGGISAVGDIAGGLVSNPNFGK